MDVEASLVGAAYADLGALLNQPSSSSSSAAVSAMELTAIASQEALAHEALFQVDVLGKIFCWLPHVVDLASAAGVNRIWRDALREDQYWRSVYVRQYGTPHLWEACSSYREQCMRRVGLRRPRPAPPLLGSPAPGISIETYDRRNCIQTIAVVYDPISRMLVRAVRSRTLLGDRERVAVQGLPLGPAVAVDSPVDGGGPTGINTAPSSGTHRQDVANKNVETSPDTDADPNASDSVLMDVVPPAAGSDDSATAAMSGTAAAAASSCPWICMLSPDGRPPPPRSADGRMYGADVGATAAGGEKYMTEEDVRQISSLKVQLPTVMCSGGGLLYLPAGPMGRGLVLWDLAAAAAVAPSPNAPPSALLKSPPPTPLPPQEPYWLVSEAHPGRLLAAAADGSLAVSACDGGRLCFWNGRQRLALGQAKNRDFTRSSVRRMIPPTDIYNIRCRTLIIAVCEASAIAAVLVSWTIYVYRAAPRQRHRCCGGNIDTNADPHAGVGQLLAAKNIGETHCCGLQLHRGQMLIMQVMSSDVYGGYGRYRVMVRAMAYSRELPEEEDEEGGEEGGLRDAAAAVAVRGGQWSDSWQRLFSSRLDYEYHMYRMMRTMPPVLAASEDLVLLTAPHSSLHLSKVLALELPPRLTHGSLEYEQEGEEGDVEEEEKGWRTGRNGDGDSGQGGLRPQEQLAGRRSGGRGMMLIPENQWTELIEDAEEVTLAVVPTPYHLAVLSNRKLRLYDIFPRTAV